MYPQYNKNHSLKELNEMKIRVLRTTYQVTSNMFARAVGYHFQAVYAKKKSS
jgi:DNA-binding transcriptional regulator YiaG